MTLPDAIDAVNRRAVEIYDELLSLHKVEDPVVVKLGTRFVVGRWVRLSEVTAEGYILRGAKRGVFVLGEGSSWEEAYEKARVTLCDSDVDQDREARVRAVAARAGRKSFRTQTDR